MSTRDTGRMSSSSVSGLACTPLEILIKSIIDDLRNSFTLTLWHIGALLSGNLSTLLFGHLRALLPGDVGTALLGNLVALLCLSYKLELIKLTF